MSAGNQALAHVGTGSRMLRSLRGLLLALLLFTKALTPGDAISRLESAPAGRMSVFSREQKASAGQFLRPTPRLPEAQAQHGARPFLAVLCKFPDVPGEPKPPEFFERLLGDNYPGLADYWRSVSYGAISLAGSTVVGWYSMPHDSNTYRTQLRDAHTEDSAVTADLQRLAEDCTTAIDRPIDWSQYFGINLVFNADLDRPRGGQVCLIRGRVDRCFGATWLWASNLADQAIWAHEIGHAFGLRHSSSGRAASNDNVWDVMSGRGVCGYDQEFQHIAQEPIAYDKDILGWIPAGRKFVAAPDSLATITLERLAMPGGAGYLLAQIPVPGASGAEPRFYTIEARRWIGYDANLPGEAVVIHEVDTGRESPARPMSVHRYGVGETEGGSDSFVMWTPGSVFRDPEHGIAVAVEKATPTGFVVTIATRHLPWPSAPRNQSIVPAGDVPFAWDPVRDAVSYELEITSEGDQRRASPIIESAENAGYNAMLAPGTYRWRVRALTAASAQPWTMSWDLAVGHVWPIGNAEPVTLPNPIPSGARGRVTTMVGKRGSTYAIWAAPNDDSQSVTGLVPGGVARTDIYVSYRPADGGWSPGVKINDNQTPAFHMLPALAVDLRGNAYAAWIDSREGHAAVFFAFRPQNPAATIGGAPREWGANVEISGDPRTSFFPPAIVADTRGNVYVAWGQGRRCGGVDIYFASRTAAGVWGPAVRITPNPTGQLLGWPSLAVDANDVVYAVWQEDRGSHVDLYAATCGANCGLPVAGAATWGNTMWIGRATDPRSTPASHVRVGERVTVCVVLPATTGRTGCVELSSLTLR